MTDEYGYTNYLRSKKTVDDRAINKDVFGALKARLDGKHLRITELGAGLGTMVGRLIDWRLVSSAEYVLVDVDSVLLADSRAWLETWAKKADLEATQGANSLRLHGGGLDWTIRFVVAELNELLAASTPTPTLRCDLLIANAFLDLVDVPVVIPQLFRALLHPGGLFWFSINFDGETIFEPQHELDADFLAVYHRSMDERVRDGRPAGDSKTGRHLFGHLRRAGGEILAAGASDWLVFADKSGTYPELEANFLNHILDTVDHELRKHPQIDRGLLTQWMTARQGQLSRGELVYLAHQVDFLGRAP